MVGLCALESDDSGAEEATGQRGGCRHIAAGSDDGRLGRTVQIGDNMSNEIINFGQLQSFLQTIDDDLGLV